jgi:hypothetical protein
MARAVAGGGDAARLNELQRRLDALERRRASVLFSRVDAQENTAAAAFVDLATNGPEITVKETGNYLAGFGGGTYVSAGPNMTSIIGLVVAGTMYRQMQTNFAGPFQIQFPALWTGPIALAAGTVVKVRYGVLVASTGEFFSRWLRLDRV